VDGSGPERVALLAALHQAMRGFTNQVTFYSEAVAAAVGIHPTDLDCLSVIDMEDGLTAGRLAEVTGLTTGAVTGVIDRLERAGYVRREADPSDRRRVVVRAVPDALGPIGAAFVPMLTATSTMAARYSDAELATITDYVTRSTPMLREETLRLRDRNADERTDAPDDAVAVTGKGVRDATLHFTNGAARLSLQASANQPQLVSASFRGGKPTVREDDDTVHVHYRRSPFGHFGRSDITLAADRRWRIEIDGGFAHSTIDARATTLDAVSVRGGVSSIELHVPRPHGTTRVEVRGGVSAMTIVRPAGVPARVRVRGGAVNLVLDDQRLGAVGGKAELRSTDPPGDDQLEVLIDGGARSLSVLAED
jgi:DNA-binding MarR family transcriptional regulator